MENFTFCAVVGAITGFSDNERLLSKTVVILTVAFQKFHGYQFLETAIIWLAAEKRLKKLLKKVIRAKRKRAELAFVDNLFNLDLTKFYKY